MLGISLARLFSMRVFRLDALASRQFRYWLFPQARIFMHTSPTATHEVFWTGVMKTSMNYDSGVLIYT